METSYKRDLEKSYLLIKNEGELVADYRMKMACRNVIPGFCQVSVKEFNGGSTLYYDISQKLSLKSLYTRNKMVKEDICRFIIGIQKSVESAREYLLDLNKILLDFEFIFMDMETGSLSFCYYPNKEEDFYDSIQKVLNEVIQNADHTDRETVIISYGIQQLSQNSNMTISDLIKFVNEKQIREAEEISDSDIKCESPEQGENPLENDLFEKDEINDSNEKTKVSIRETLGNFISKFFGKNDYVGIDEMSETLDNANVKTYEYANVKTYENANAKTYENANVKTYENSSAKTYENSSAKIYENANVKTQESTNVKGTNEYADNEDSYDEYDAETILLKTGTEYGIFALKSTDIESEEVFMPREYPCIIGKSKRSSNFVINDMTISRVHLRINEEDDGFYIEDLNSSNGTYLNGERIKPHKPYKVNSGDRIMLSELEYVVC